jgi:hypothetical protein
MVDPPAAGRIRARPSHEFRCAPTIANRLGAAQKSALLAWLAAGAPR